MKLINYDCLRALKKTCLTLVLADSSRAFRGLGLGSTVLQLSTLVIELFKLYAHGMRPAHFLGACV